MTAKFVTITAVAALSDTRFDLAAGEILGVVGQRRAHGLGAWHRAC